MAAGLGLAKPEFLEAAQRMAELDGGLSPYQARRLLRAAVRRLEAPGAGAAAQTVVRCGRTLIFGPAGKAELVHEWSPSPVEFDPVLRRSSELTLGPRGKIEIVPSRDPSEAELQAVSRAAAQLLRIGPDLNMRQARVLVWACKDIRESVDFDLMPSTVIAKARETGLARTLQIHKDGTVGIWLRRVIGRGTDKTAKLAALVRFAEDGTPQVERAVKATAEVERSDAYVRAMLKREREASRALRGEKHLVETHDVLVRNGKNLALARGSPGYDATDPLAIKYVHLTKYYARGDLRARFYSGPWPALNRQQCKQLAFDLLSGLAAMHAKGWMHLDIKPENVFLEVRDGHERAVLADLGFAGRVGDRAAEEFKGYTDQYCAPELGERLRRRVLPKRTQKDDIFAMGVTLHELLLGRPPYFSAGNPLRRWADMSDENMQRAGMLPDGRDPLRDLVLRMCSREPDKRPTAAEALGALRAAFEQSRVVVRTD